MTGMTRSEEIYRDPLTVDQWKERIGKALSLRSFAGEIIGSLAGYRWSRAGHERNLDEVVNVLLAVSQEKIQK